MHQSQPLAEVMNEGQAFGVIFFDQKAFGNALNIAASQASVFEGPDLLVLKVASDYH